LVGFEPRAAQVEMAQALLRRLVDGGVAVVEAPTGVGKTLAYLVAALLSGRRVLISTHTKTLQDQIIGKDLEILRRIAKEMGLQLERATPEPPPDGGDPSVRRYALMKGRSNYLCLAKLEKKTRQGDLGFDDDDPWSTIAAWSQRTERGDRAELPLLSDHDPRWAEVDARSDTCTGVRCPQYDSCFVGRMRREAQGAEIIVVNHHLLLSDLALRARASLAAGGRMHFEVVPEVDSLILDEAHGLETVASEYFGGSVSGRMVDRLGRDVAEFLSAGSEAAAGVSVLATQATVGATELLRTVPQQPGRTRVTAHERAFESARDRLPTVRAGLESLSAALEALPSGDPAALNLARRSRDLAESFRFVLEAEDPAFVYWSESQGRSTTLGASPIDVANLLRAHLFDRFFAVGMCSATLATGGDLDYFLSATGAPTEADRMVLPSPFDYRRQAALFVPEDSGDPDAPTATDRLVRTSLELVDITGGGALLLFTSVRAMRAAHRRLRSECRLPCFVQGQFPKGELIRRFIEQAPAVLCATASFWEGVDIPGRALQLVVIDRLPFESPGDPLVAARAERARSRGANPFSSLFLPRAILRLKQGFGRLVRSPHDRGVVAVLDGRIRARAYGRRFIEALPEVPQFAATSDLRRWWEAPST
jgi:ATP-dependent DNA helicase DinG